MLISFGYSCQTQFSINQTNFDFLRRPFDFNITSLQALTRALETEGRSLEHDIGSVSIFTMPRSGRQGVECDGVYFWHDYPTEADGKTLASNWKERISIVNEKYRSIWPRFSDLLRSSRPKTVVLSNSQSNLTEFAKDPADFSQKFGLGPDAYTQIMAALSNFGAQNFKLKFLTRDLDDLRRCYEQIDDQGFEIQFVGVLSLPTNTLVASSLSLLPNVDIRDACGIYDNGRKEVRILTNRTAIIYIRKSSSFKLWGSLIAMNDGYLGSFLGRDKSFKAVLDEDGLYFSNRSRWKRAESYEPPISLPRL